MWGRLFSIALIATPTAIWASEWEAPADCAALFYGHHIYDTRHFDPADVSDGWKVMSDDFATAAKNRGASAEQISDIVKSRSEPYAESIKEWIFSGVEAHPILKRQAICDQLVNSLPELADHRQESE